jgi:glycosyltransferase involved in cell wall biosynthesis
VRVLLLCKSLFNVVGGGETFYTRVLACHPDLHFTCLYSAGSSLHPLLNHVTFIEQKPIDCSDYASKGFSKVRKIAFQNAVNIANSVKGLSFDIIEVPDFELVGPYLPSAFAHFDVEYRSMVHAMHGRLSDSVSRNWGTMESDISEYTDLEDEQFLSADYHYAISPRYRADYLHLGKPIELVNPWGAVRWRPLATQVECASHPRIICAGRRERRKGNDIAIEIVKWLPPELSDIELLHIGDAIAVDPFQTSDQILAEYAHHRNVDFLTIPSMSQDQLATCLANNAIALLPTRYDTLNLIALEAALAGVPVVLSHSAGAADILKELGDVNSIQFFDVDYPEQAADKLAIMIKAWPQTLKGAQRVAASLQSRMKFLSLRGVYQNALSCELRSAKPDFLGQFEYFEQSNPLNAASIFGSVIQSGRRLPEKSIIRRLARGARHIWRKSGRQSLSECNGSAILNRARKLPEKSSQDMNDKIALLAQFQVKNGGRVKVWLELARLERLRGNILTAACYDLRVLRLAGKDLDNRIGIVRPTLQKSGLGFVNQALKLGEIEKDTPSTFIESPYSFGDVETKPVSALVAKIVDTRIPVDRRVSIIVSLFRASIDRIERFLTLLSRQTLFEQGLIEIVFIDAGGCEFLVELIGNSSWPFKFSYVYAQTSERVTIQSAWNLGLKLSSAPFICCLGADETLYPQSLEILAKELEAASHIDWVMGSSLVMEMSESGAYLNDKIFYDRSDVLFSTTYLETCTLSWVGGLYRRDVHERFGYYDDRFHAAGDTEFKMRVLQHLKVKFLPQTLGVLLDYPEQRASGGVRAEIEDSAAWYGYRTIAGARVALQYAKSETLLQIAHQCGGYRKSFSKTMSTDVTMGKSVCKLLRERKAPIPYLSALESFFEARVREFQEFDLGTPIKMLPASLTKREKRFAKINAEFLSITGVTGHFCGLNDNLYEQHNWVWTLGCEPSLW